jgi:tripartite-type tricarboxylate transporter receptor subunit TctC
MVVSYAAGGTFDVMGRIVAVRMSEILGQQIVVENTTGAGGIIGVNRVRSSSPRARRGGSSTGSTRPRRRQWKPP